VLVLAGVPDALPPDEGPDRRDQRPGPPSGSHLRRLYELWPMLLSMACGTLVLTLGTVDLLIDWTVTPGAMPLYGALLAVATGGAVLGRK
jgi:hypothetical protein